MIAETSDCRLGNPTLPVLRSNSGFRLFPPTGTEPQVLEPQVLHLQNILLGWWDN